jgi:hypothetical protein
LPNNSINEGHGFSRAAKSICQDSALAAEGTHFTPC